MDKRKPVGCHVEDRANGETVIVCPNPIPGKPDIVIPECPCVKAAREKLKSSTTIIK